MANSLWTPNGEVRTTERAVRMLNPTEVRMLAWLHEWAAKEQVNIFCKRCEKPIAGFNNDSPDRKHASVACQCREWRFTGA